MNNTGSQTFEARVYRGFLNRASRIFFPSKYKQVNELSFWKSRVAEEKVLRNDHYSYFYREFFGLDPDFYRGKTILDIGCGPRGSLEWASEAAERIGLDSLASQYLKLGADKHKMRYVDTPAERMPFDNDYFDVVCTFNSLDHVDDLAATVAQIKRVLKPGGTFLIIVEVDHPPTPCEPVTITNVPSLFGDAFELIDLRKYEIGDHDIYGQLLKDARFVGSAANRPGIVAAHFVKPATAPAGT
jgi:ubiquinone/menaquinone biosynthesis C-methylase UbiE